MPSIFDLPSVIELDALMALTELPLDLQVVADAVRIAVSKGA